MNRKYSGIICSMALAISLALSVVGCNEHSSKNTGTMASNHSRQKHFAIPGDQIKPLATGRGGCIATDMITVDGRKVAFMYREQPSYEMDSGWRFTSGVESNVYMDDPGNHGVYDVNTIANYDQEIIPLLDAPTGSVFERTDGTGKFRAVHDFQPPTD